MMVLWGGSFEVGRLNSDSRSSWHNEPSGSSGRLVLMLLLAGLLGLGGIFYLHRNQPTDTGAPVGVPGVSEGSSAGSEGSSRARLEAEASRLDGLSLAAFQRGDYDQSIAMLKRLVPLYKNLYGEKHPYVADSLMHIGECYVKEGRAADAERYYLEALAIYDANGDQMGGMRPQALRGYAGVLRQLGRSDEAEKYEKSAAE